MRKSIPNGIWAVSIAATRQLVGLYAPLSGHWPTPGSEDGGMMHDGGSGKRGGRGVGGEDFYNRRIIILIGGPADEFPANFLIFFFARKYQTPRKPRKKLRTANRPKHHFR